MSDTETAAQQRVTRGFASRLLTKELETRMKTTQQNKIDTSKFPNPPEEGKKE